MIKKGIISHKGYDYKYTITSLGIEDGEEISNFSCKKVNMNQVFPTADIPELLKDLPNIIDKLTKDNKRDVIRLRVSKLEKLKFQQEAKNLNMTLSEYIKTKCLI